MVHATITCDKCGKPITKEIGGFRITIVDGFNNQSLNIDLCTKCYEPLRKALIKYLKPSEISTTDKSNPPNITD